VVGVSEEYLTSIASFSCGAPTSIAFDIPTVNTGAAGIANGAFGHVIFTRGGAFNLSQGNLPDFTPFATNGIPCDNICFGPVTFFLNSPSMQTIVLSGFTDDGPSPLYINGGVVIADSSMDPVTGGLNGSGGTLNVTIPQGPFSISFESCSNNG